MPLVPGGSQAPSSRGLHPFPASPRFPVLTAGSQRSSNCSRLSSVILATLGISVLNHTSYSSPVHLPHQYKSLPGYHIPQHTGSLSHSPLSETHRGRGGPTPCLDSQRLTYEIKPEHMPHTPPVSEPLKDDALRTEPCSLSEKKRPRLDDDSHSSEDRDLVRPRPLSWRPSAPVEPPLQAAQLRSIGVHSILNSPARSAPSLVHSRGDNLMLPSSAPASHVRLPSSPTMHLASPSIHHAKRPSLSPRLVNRQIISPVSPTARFVGSVGPYARQPGTVKSPLAQESRPGLYALAPGSPLPLENAPANPKPASETMAPAPVSIHSTPTFHSRQPSANPTPIPSSQETSPTTPVSLYSPFGRLSPAIAGMPIPQSAPSFANPPIYGTAEPVSRLPSVAGDRPAGDEQNAPPLPGMIPCILDLKSGSSSQAEKRKANSDASRRFRNRKRNEMQMEQKITAQQDEIRKQQETLLKQAQEIRELMQERDHYRSERDFYREHVTRLVPPGHLPARPPSPQAYRSVPEREAETTWSGAETRRATNATGGSAGNPPASNAVSGLPVRQENWHNTPSYPVRTDPHHVS